MPVPLLAAPSIDIPNPFLSAIVALIVLTLVMTFGVMFATWYERKFVARVQQRLGPMRVGPWGLLQPIADTVKLLTKEDVRPRDADPVAWHLSIPVIFVPSFVALVVVPWTADWVISPISLSLLYLLAVAGLSFIGFLLAGWGSNSKYALLGGLRAGAQLIAYEVPLILAAIAVVMVVASADVYQIILYQDVVPLIVWQPLAFIIFLTAAVAELERQPFDIPTGESEVAGGVFIEYSGIRWSMFQLTAYVNMYLFSLLGAFLFLGGWQWPFGTDVGWGYQLLLSLLKMSIFIVFFLWVRASFPRMRVDHLMSYAWKVLVPFALLQIFLNGLVIAYDLPDAFFLLFSGAGAALLVFLVYRMVRATPREPLRMVPSTARATPAPAAASGSTV